ncbi:hypothetical protein [Actinoplanes cyaneus]|nr:hypothetical protein [Actinoplanes cyaneus]
MTAEIMGPHLGPDPAMGRPRVATIGMDGTAVRAGACAVPR